MTFKELGIIEPILRALSEKGYENPSAIQEKSIPVILKRKDILGLAQTGTGKTAAFAVPLLQKLYLEKENKKLKPQIRGLIITPTRELAIQIAESFKDYGKYTGLKYCVVYGGVKQKRQTDQLRAGTDILIATPGRLLDLMGQGFVFLKKIDYLVLDEADRMLDMGFINDIRKILEQIPAERQTLMFSATMPTNIASLSRSMQNKPVRVEVTPESSTVDTISQYLYYVDRQEKRTLLIDLLNKDTNDSVLVFSKTKHGADKICNSLCHAGITSGAIHGNKSQANRQRTLGDFKSGRLRVLIATDIAARGIDVDDLELVINYDLPDVAQTYVHRIGRTGRAGKSGTAISFCSREENRQLKDIRKLVGNKTITVNKNIDQFKV
ncbi:MAG: DEAD/DEAH box helicase [Bacteroidales bacterium]|jgi:ATP-dependent RNA helicase RhlE|nr:DEAD/DEAH box helicase [Bacteroidales bacterium]